MGRQERGAAAVELALVTPLLLLMLFGVIDFGRMLNAQITLTEAAREGARAASLGYSAGPRVTAVAGDVGVVSVQTTPCAANAAPSANATVVVTHAFQPVTPIGAIMSMFGGDEDGAVTIHATGVMPCLG
jgi:Flp pilus assembly protein TadG